MPRRSLVLVAGVLATSSALSPAVAPAMRVGGMRVAQRPRFATSIRMQESFPTLEEEVRAAAAVPVLLPTCHAPSALGAPCPPS